MSFLPKNASKILASKALQRDFFLKPYGLESPTNMHVPKKHPQYKFFQNRLLLHRPGKDHGDNVLTFKTNPRYSKPELRQYIEKLYGLDIEKIHTARFMGKVKMNMLRQFKSTKAWKKVFVYTRNQIDPFLNKPT